MRTPLIAAALLFLTPFPHARAQSAPAPAQAPSGNATLTVAAASDLQPVLPQILPAFERLSGIRVTVSFGSTTSLATQILNGAPFDLFLAADSAAPQRIAAANLADAAPLPYAFGTLVLWQPNAQAFCHPLTLDCLRSPALARLAVANPATAPYGRAAAQTIQSLGLTNQLAPHLVTAENIAQAAQFADSGNAQLALISLTLAHSPTLAARGSYILIPRDNYSPLIQSAIVLRNSSHRTAAHQFLDYLLSPAIQSQFHALGLEPAAH
jgi:molybdate transport system substrate-binding protein